MKRCVFCTSGKMSVMPCRIWCQLDLPSGTANYQAPHITPSLSLHHYVNKSQTQLFFLLERGVDVVVVIACQTPEHEHDCDECNNVPSIALWLPHQDLSLVRPSGRNAHSTTKPRSSFWTSMIRLVLLGQFGPLHRQGEGLQCICCVCRWSLKR